MKRTAVALLRALVIPGIILVMTVCLAGAQVDCSVTDNLQATINSAANGSTITVTGTCTSNIIVYPVKVGITIDGQGSAAIQVPVSTNKAAVEIRGAAITLRGFTITGGLDGIIMTPHGSGVIDSNTIQGAGRNGISIVEGGEAMIVNNTIRDNTGAGIALSESASARIGIRNSWDTSTSPNTIQDNGGSGIYVGRSSVARILGNTIKSNGNDGITVERASQADVAGNTIDSNTQNGIRVTGNSGLNLGNAAGTTIYDVPNQTTTGAKNGSAGIRCTLGGYVDGRKGALKGAAGQIVIGSGCVNNAH